MEMDVSVIFVNYNTVRFLCDSIDSVILNTESMDYEIIVVDNASQDNSLKIITRKYRKKVRYIALPENIGFGRANNEGIKAATGRNIFLLNPDTILINNAVKILCEYVDGHSQTAMAGGNLYDKEMLPAYSYRRFFPSVFWELNDLFFCIPEKIVYGKNAHFNNTGMVLDVAYITGADLMIPKRVLDKEGYFNPDYFMYFEESDLAYRIHNCGYRIESIPQAKVQHIEGVSFIQKTARLENYYRGKLLFYRKHFSRGACSVLKIIMLATFYSRIIAFRLLFKRTKLNEWKTTLNIFSTVNNELSRN
jgi:GT2 family glycosyltransferase